MSRAARSARLLKNAEAALISAIEIYNKPAFGYSQQLSPLIKSFFDLVGQAPSNQKKFVAALKFDPFNDGWVVKALDQADRQQEFKTENVNRLLAVPIR